jgi:hypothetical protein
MIGGSDIVIAHASPSFAVEVLAAIERRWPRMVVDPMPQNNLFVYETVGTRTLIDRHGIIESVSDSYIHVLLGDESTTMVVCPREESVTHRIAAELKQKWERA